MKTLGMHRHSITAIIAFGMISTVTSAHAETMGKWGYVSTDAVCSLTTDQGGAKLIMLTSKSGATGILAMPADQSAPALLALVPGAAPLWINPAAQDVDWALAAEIVLLHQPALRPFQTNGLRAFIESEREARFARLNTDYQPPVAQAGGAGAVCRRSPC